LLLFIYINIFKASRRRIAINQPPKPISCRVYRYFTPAASRLANAVSVSTETFGAGMFVCLSIFLFDINCFLLALESPFYTKSITSTYWDQCFEHLECLGRGSFAEVEKKRFDLNFLFKCLFSGL
jgi:hypothetical protein